MDEEKRKRLVNELLKVYPTFRRMLCVHVEAAGRQMTKSQLHILLCLTECETFTTSKLAEASMTSPQQLTKVVKELENRRLVKRVNDKKERRLVWVSLTAKGRTSLEEHKVQLLEELLPFFDQLTVEEIVEFVELTGKLNELLRKVSGRTENFVTAS